MRVLVADDQPDVVMALRLLLKSEGYQTESAANPAELLRAATTQTFDLILMDLNYTRDTTSGEEGLNVLLRLKEVPTSPPAIVMTAWSSIDLAVEAMRRGAVDFVTKPWDNQRLLSTLRKNASPKPASQRHAELDIARKVQNNLFPQVKPELAGLDYSGLCVEAGAVGGDYFDFLDLAPSRLGLILADVCGKGMAAALLMANLQATMRSHCRNAPDDWTRVMEQVNELFFRSTAPEHFATAFIGDYNDTSHVLRYVNCGHNPPLVLRSSGQFERLESTGLVLGAFRRFHCATSEIQLAAGDWLVLFSDGVVEAQSEFDVMFDEQRLMDIIHTNRQASPDELIDAVRSALDRFATPVGRDDWTIVAARVR